MATTLDRPSVEVSAHDLARIPSEPRWLRIVGVAGVVAFVGAQALGVLTSPPDRDMGDLQKIMYVHVPAAWNAFIAFFIVAIASIKVLLTNDERADLLAAAAAEVGAALTALTLILGSIWGRPTWGVWWTWDARLTSTAVLLVIFVGYLTLREFAEEPERRMRWSAAVGVIGALNVPIVYMSVRWWRTLHQIQSSPATVDPHYVVGLRTNAIAFLLLLVFFIGLRYHLSRVQAAIAQRAERRALFGVAIEEEHHAGE
jgi:heme exporter protein C